MPDLVQRLAAQATRYTTPCGAGEVVWRRWGAGQNGVRPLVLLHGGSGSWTHWVRNIEDLVAAGQTLWVPDLPGFGDSALPSWGSDADAVIEPLHAGLQQLLHGQACDLVGFSFGGMTAGMLLAAHPALAARLVLVGAPAMGVVPQRQFQLKAWRHLPTPEQQIDIHRYNLAALMLHDAALIDGLALQTHLANMQRDRMPRRRLSHTDILARSLAQVVCPVHAIYGQHDAVYRDYIGQLAGAYAAAAPDFRGLALIEGAGHWVQFERPQAFHAALLAALAG
ncbi:alpha/beta fold hydrolase [Simplicispira psychrophila]|uniref:alpha/beta fold hydrolase n=1 Tax=Simplicispira psychrophila TaxID=80882 RepID=UPI001FE240AA|nr:alpha/beta hydrolase [Simplicispira psychrophila]